LLAAAVVGATGYTGAELMRILSRHPYVKVVGLTSRKFAGQTLSQVYPFLLEHGELLCEELEPHVLEKAEVAFLALPHGHGAELADLALKKGVRVIDLGPDFRLKDPKTYQEWYKLNPPPLSLLQEAVYGLTEIYRGKIKDARLVANPGCYPTSVILALAPLLKRGLLHPQSIVIDSKSGVSGAGREPQLATLFVECQENISPYKVARHRHLPEMEQEMSRLAGCPVQVTFTPHLVPMIRGILSTIYGNLTQPATEEELRQLYREFYEGEPFVRLLPPGVWPHTRWVYGSNYCLLNLTLDERTGRVVVVSAIDNLTKGAAGQAVQNLNVMCGFPEETALKELGLCP